MDIVLLLPVDPVGPWALPVEGSVCVGWGGRGYEERHVGVSYATVRF